MSALVLTLRFFCLSLAGGARVSTEEAQEVDWRKFTVVGALAAHALSAASVAGVPAQSKEPPSGDDDPPGLEARLRAALQGALEVEDERAAQALVANLMQGQFMDEEDVENFEADVKARGLNRFTGPTEETRWKRLWRRDLETDVEHFGVHRDDGSRGYILKRYHAAEKRGPLEVLALENVLRSLSRAGGCFLRALARSHSAEHLSWNPHADVLVLFEPFSSSLRDYFKAHEVSLHELSMTFLSLMSSVSELHRKGIPHNPILTPDNILIAGTRVVLCPSILNTQLLPACSRQKHFWSWRTREPPEGCMNWDDLRRKDLRQLGSLLAWMTGKLQVLEGREALLVLAEGMHNGHVHRLGGGFDDVMQLFWQVVPRTDQADDMLSGVS